MITPQRIISGAEHRPTRELSKFGMSRHAVSVDSAQYYDGAVRHSQLPVDPAVFGAVGYRHQPVYFRTTGAPGGRRSLATQTDENVFRSMSVDRW